MKKQLFHYLIMMLIQVLDSGLVNDLINRIIEYIRERLDPGEADTVEGMLRPMKSARNLRTRHAPVISRSMFSMVIEQILDYLEDFEITDMAGMILDFIEEKVLGTHNKIDDALVLPMCEFIRRLMDIPDEIE